MAKDRRLLRRLLRRLTVGVALPDREKYGSRSSAEGVCREVDESLLKIHDCPLLSRDPSVNVNPVWINQEGSVWIWRRWDLWPNPWPVKAPDGVTNPLLVAAS
jgi:hypothetical protein